MDDCKIRSRSQTLVWMRSVGVLFGLFYFFPWNLMPHQAKTTTNSVGTIINDKRGEIIIKVCGMGMDQQKSSGNERLDDQGRRNGFNKDAICSFGKSSMQLPV